MWDDLKAWLYDYGSAMLQVACIGIIFIIIGSMFEQDIEATKISIGEAFIIAGFIESVQPAIHFILYRTGSKKKEQQINDMQEKIDWLYKQAQSNN